ncbi:MAG: hypothetical protein HY537_17420 [Deltaproteobacteria bacterium]|nr:hypothetical protein [Deltaproteobacteria bacterium]
MKAITIFSLLLSVSSVFGGPLRPKGTADFKTKAFGGPGIPFSWATSAKQGVGTAYEAYDSALGFSKSSSTAPISRVWFTIARGILTEVYYPRVDTAQTRDTQILVTDGKSFLHQEQFDTRHEIERESGAPLFKIKNSDPWNRYAIFKEIWADPDSPVVIQKIKIERYVDGLQFYILHKPTAGNSIFGDSAESSPFVAGETGKGFSGWQGLSASVPWQRTSVGYVGYSDGFTDLKDFLMDYRFETAPSGNVAFTGQLHIPRTSGSTTFNLFLFFADSKEEILAQYNQIGSIDLEQSQKRYLEQWKTYLDGLSLPLTQRATFERKELLETSILILKSSEDKTYSGAVVASPSFPWGETAIQNLSENAYNNVGYHVIWPRDLYHIGNGFLAVGDKATATAVGKRFTALQFKEGDGTWNLGPRSHVKKGSFPQNCWTDGKTTYSGYQADQTAMPILFAYRLWKRNLVKLEEVYPMVKDAASFLAEMGPWTQAERWEEAYGISPNSAAYAIAAVEVASELITAAGEPSFGAALLNIADQWATKTGDNIDTWTFTKTGKIEGTLGDGRYYLRLDGAKCKEDGSAVWDAWWNPNFDELTCIANYSGSQRFRYETEVVDAGFLALARLGVRSAKHALIRESLPETDNCLKRETPRGAGWYRYRFDAYGEHGRGRLWPLLTGERLHYELEWLKENQEPDLAGALEQKLRAYESMATSEGIFAEQVWDEGEVAGKPTGSASPLCWAHAEYIQLLRSIYDRGVFEENLSVRKRYGAYKAYDSSLIK